MLAFSLKIAGHYNSFDICISGGKCKCFKKHRVILKNISSDIFRYKNEVNNGEGRILVMNIGSDLLGEHNILMNIFFAAHKNNILIDVANIG